MIGNRIIIFEYCYDKHIKDFFDSNNASVLSSKILQAVGDFSAVTILVSRRSLRRTTHSGCLQQVHRRPVVHSETVDAHYGVVVVKWASPRCVT